MSVRLESWYVAGDREPGSMRLRLVNAGPSTISGFELALTTVVQLTPEPPARLVRRTSGHHVIAPPLGLALAPGGVWTFDVACGHRPRHANDGPASAYLVLDDDTTMPVRTGPTVCVVRTEHAPLRLAPAPAVVATAWAQASQREQRLSPHGAAVLSSDSGADVTATIDEAIGAEEFTIGADLTVVGGSPVALQHAFASLASDHRAGLEPRRSRHRPAHAWRGLHVDLARQFFPADDIDWLIDVAACRGFNRLHLHLTDDEAWRVPIAAYPALTEVGAWRGHGLALPPLLGSGAAPHGGSYTRAEIAGWVQRAATAGIEMVPEVDLPGHCAAALAAVPALRDPHDRSGAVSVQHFVDNVLNPGVDATWPFLEAVVGDLADLFPSPWLHVGGDEVPDGAWSGSPAARSYAARRGVSGSPVIGATFLRDIVELVATTGRRVGVWQEGAESGALRPGEGYVIGWRSAQSCRELAGAGHDVVASPAERYYLDMAADASWDTPGTGWAGHSSVADIAAFDITAGWSNAERDHLVGVQACVWTEHAPDRPSLERLLFPRLDTIAAEAWTTEY